MQAKGIPPKVVNDFLKTYGMGRVGKAKATMGYFKDYGLSDKALQTIGRGFNAETIEIIQNTYMRSKVFYSGTDTDLILILFKQAGSSEAASTLSNSLITLGNSGIVPSAFAEYGIISSISGMSPAVTALSTGITPALMKKLFGFGIRPTDYDGYGIVGADSAETVAEALTYQVNRLKALGITNADTLKNAGKSVVKVLDESGLSFAKFQEIIETPKPLRPAPSTYLDSSYITKHLSQFDNGGSYVMTLRQYENFVEGRPLLGREDNSLYIVPKEYMDSIATSANGNISVFEKRLGFSEGYFQDGGGLVRIDIKDPKGYNLRMATGNEAGANDFYTPGGFTSGGSPEAVVNNIPNSDDFRTITFMN